MKLSVATELWKSIETFANVEKSHDYACSSAERRMIDVDYLKAWKNLVETFAKSTGWTLIHPPLRDEWEPSFIKYEPIKKEN